MTVADLPRLLVGLLLAALAPLAQAVDYCVGTQGTFQNALDEAEADGADSVIKLRSGTYNLSFDPRYEPTLEYIVPAGKLTIRGGYNTDCSSYSLSAGATTINGGGVHSLRLNTETGTVAIAGLTVLNGWIAADDGALTECLETSPTFTFRRLRVDQGSLYLTAKCHDVIVENSLLSNGIRFPGTQLGADTALYIYLVNNSDYSPTSLTVASSTVVNGRLHLLVCCDGISSAFLFNSIFDRAAGSEIFSDANIYALNNRFDGIAYSNGASLILGSGNNSSAAPQLSAQYVPVAGSPMINTGTANVPDGLPDTDHAGGERVIGAGVDRGALESPIDGTGVYVVTNTNASGNGSLANAVDLANAETGANTIRFNIAGGLCPRRITLTAPLQIRDGVTLDGWSQPGSVKNTEEFGFNAIPCVVLNGGGTVGIGIEAMAQLSSNGGRIIARGLGFEGFNLAIALAFGADHAIYGNQFGGRVGQIGGITLSGNAQAIGLIGGGRTTVGGMSAASRNLIGGSSDVGVLITTFLGGGGDDNEVINNLIGLDKDGGSALPNGTGIRINGGFNLIRDNRIGGNTVDGILLASENAEGNVIARNDIGGGLGQLSLVVANGRAGVLLQADAHDNTIGPDNIIGRNGDSGVRLLATAGGHNRITANRMNRNDSPGIDLGANGVTANDFDPQLCNPTLGCAANREQNFPVLTEVVRKRTGIIPVGRPVRVTGSLRSTTSTTAYRVELFGSDSCYTAGHGQGSRYLGTVNVVVANAGFCANGNCTASFTTWLPELDLDIGDVVTATATSPGDDTSEFSACMTVVDEPTNDLIFADNFEN